MNDGYNTPWWKDKELAANNIFGLVRTITDKQAILAVGYARYQALYANNELLPWAASVFGRSLPDVRLSRVSYNIVASMVDTLVARHAANQPRISVLTNGGDWEQQRRARKSEKFLAGEFDRLKLYRIAPMVLRDALIFGDGVLKFFCQYGKITCERVYPGEIVVDNDEAKDGSPRQLFQTRFIDRDLAKSIWPKFKEDIDVAPLADTESKPLSTSSNLIKIVEAWHLPSGPDAGDGKHCISIDGCCLEYEDWEYNAFPFARVSWTPAIQGWYSQSLADQLMPIQVEINKLLRRAQLSMHLLSVPRVYVESGSRIVKSTFNNDVGSIVEYTGVPPTIKTDAAVNPEIFGQIDRLFARAYELSGISALEASARKPADLESGVALREYANIASERHAYFSLQWQEFFRDCAWQVFRCARELGPKYRSLGMDQKVLQPVKWSDCELDDEEYSFSLAAANVLPTSPAGKLDRVQSLAQAGILTPEEAKQLLEYPDIQAVTKQSSVPKEHAKWVVYKMLEDGEYMPPEPFWDLASCMREASTAYLEGEQSGAPEDRLDLLRVFIRDIDYLLNPPPPPEPVPEQAPVEPTDQPMLPEAETTPPMI